MMEFWKTKATLTKLLQQSPIFVPLQLPLPPSRRTNAAAIDIHSSRTTWVTVTLRLVVQLRTSTDGIGIIHQDPGCLAKRATICSIVSHLRLAVLAIIICHDNATNGRNVVRDTFACWSMAVATQTGE